MVPASGKDFDARMIQSVTNPGRGDWRTTTGPAGDFQFHGLPKNQYVLWARKNGYFDLQADNSKRITVRLEHGSAAGVKLSLAPLAVVQGSVTDQDGEPVRYARIVAFRRSVNDGFARYDQARDVSTDDRGAYKLWNLYPGAYFIRAEGRYGGTLSIIDDSSGARSVETFPARYSGGATSITQAEPLVLDGGSRARVDFRVTLERAYRIQGTLPGVTEGLEPQFQLLHGGEPVSTHRAGYNWTNGRFEVFDVPAGQYVLRAKRASLTSEAPVRVGGDANPPPVSMPPLGGERPAANLRVFLNAEGEAKSQGPLRNVRGCTANLRSTDVFDWNPQVRSKWGSPPNPSVTFDVVTGKPHLFYVHCDGSYVTGMRMGSADLTQGAILRFEPGVDPDPIYVTYRQGGGTVNVECEPCKSRSHTEIVAVPVRDVLAGAVSILCEPAECSVKSLKPGEYRIFAFSRLFQTDYRSPGFLDRTSGGVPVVVEEGSSKTVVVRELAK